MKQHATLLAAATPVASNQSTLGPLIREIARLTHPATGPKQHHLRTDGGFPPSYYYYGDEVIGDLFNLCREHEIDVPDELYEAASTVGDAPASPAV